MACRSADVGRPFALAARLYLDGPPRRTVNLISFYIYFCSATVRQRSCATAPPCTHLRRRLSAERTAGPSVPRDLNKS